MNNSYRKHKYRKKLIAEINIVPYIDVTLVLLVIFMVTAPLQQSAVAVSLPTADGTTIENKDQLPIIISVAKDGQYYLSEKESPRLPITISELLFSVASLQKNSPQISFYIQADKSVDYGSVIAVMNALKKAGISQVGLMTSPIEP